MTIIPSCPVDRDIWTPEIALIETGTYIDRTSLATIDYHNITESGAAKGDCYGDMWRFLDLVFVNFCMEFTLSYPALAKPCIVMIKGLKYQPGCGQNAGDSTSTTRGTGIGNLFLSDHSRFSTVPGVPNAALPTLPAGVSIFHWIATPFWNALHMEGLQRPGTSYSPKLLTTDEFPSGARRYLRGNAWYSTVDEMVQ